MRKIRLDALLSERRLTKTRSQAEDFIKRGFVEVNGDIVLKPGHFVDAGANIHINYHESFVSRAGEKLNSVMSTLGIDFKNRVVLDVGSSTGGFSELSLRRGAKKVIAVELGTDQMDISLREDPRIELHEKTDIRNFATTTNVDVVLIDVSFISLREVLPSIRKLITPKSIIVAMVKPQFEAINSDLKHKGVIKNDHIRREILKEFEKWCRSNFVIVAKADSKVSGAKGNIERFYLLTSK